MIQALITDRSITEEKHFNNVDNITLVNPLDTLNAIKQINNLPNRPIEVYDYTFSPKHKEGEVIMVSDHINMTGDNPLIGNQKEIPREFVDISNLYHLKKGVTTTCLGEYFNKHKHKHKYPSTYLCYIAIIVRALERKNISAFLINSIDRKKR